MESKPANAPLRKIGEVAELFGVTPRTVLFYEEEGILSPARTAGGTRVYSEQDVRRFDIAYRMASLGIPVKTIRDLAQTRPNAETGDVSGRVLHEMLEQIKLSVKVRLAELQGLSENIEQAQTHLKGCWNCPNKPDRAHCPDCPCEAHKDETPVLWLTWDAGAEPACDDGKAPGPDSDPEASGQARARGPRLGRRRLTSAKEVGS